MKNERGTALVAALTLVILIFMITTLCLGRISSSYTHIIMHHNRSSALFLADAGIQKAAQQLISNAAYTGEKGSKLATGHFDVNVLHNADAYIITSTGYADSPFEIKPKTTVQAVVKVEGNTFRIVEWRENP